MPGAGKQSVSCLLMQMAVPAGLKRTVHLEPGKPNDELQKYAFAVAGDARPPAPV